MAFNRVILMGRLTRDPELKTTQSGISVTSFQIAVDRRYRAGEDKQADFKTDLDIINKNSHGFSLIDNSILNNDSNGMRIQKAVRDIIAILYCKDSHHVHCMIGSLINGNSNRKHKLEEWSKSWRE